MPLNKTLNKTIVFVVLPLLCGAVMQFIAAPPYASAKKNPDWLVHNADAGVSKALAMLDRDPPIAQIQAAALEYFAVTKGDIDGFRMAARLSALLPTIGGKYTQDDNKLNRNETDFAQFVTTDQFPSQITEGSAGVGRFLSASASWDLGALIFDSNQLETYSLVGIHEDIVKEVTRLYYTRQHNLLSLTLDPPKTTKGKVALLIRTRELEAMLDALTGGAWSRLARQRS